MRSNHPLGVKQGVALSEGTRRVLDNIEKYPLPYVEKRLIESGRLKEKVVAGAMREFKRFVALTFLCRPPLAIPNSTVDEVWHQLILFTPQYAQFCRYTVGKFINHLPNTPETPVPYAAVECFLRAYERYFGRLDPVWGMDRDLLSPLRKTGDSRPKPSFTWSGWVG